MNERRLVHLSVRLCGLRWSNTRGILLSLFVVDFAAQIVFNFKQIKEKENVPHSIHLKQKHSSAHNSNENIRGAKATPSVHRYNQTAIYGSMSAIVDVLIFDE